MMNLITTLNNKGYGIKKTENNQDIINKIKSELLVSPKVFSNAFASQKEYPIYMENDNKIYVPKCYGIEKFGKPKSRTQTKLALATINHACLL